MKAWVVVAVLCGAARVARADPPARRPGGWLVLTEGVAAGAVPIIAATQIFSTDSTSRAVTIAAVTPLVVGGVVCAVSKLSDRYQGPCWPALVGAYLGAATLIPLGYLGAAIDNSGEPSQGDVHLPVFSFILPAVAWFVYQPGAAVAGWLLFAHERAGRPVLNPPPLPPPPRPAFAPERPRGLALAPGERSLPLLSVGF